MYRILVVDDNFVNRKLLLELLKEDAHCDVAVDGREALDAYYLSFSEQTPYDMILLDIAMPDVGGIEVLRTIRDDERDRGVAEADRLPIIIVTIFDEFYSKAYEAGCILCFLKPLDINVLKEKILSNLSSPKTE